MTATFTSAAVGYPPEITWQWQGSPDGIFWDNLSDGSGYEGVTTTDLEVTFEDASLDGWWYRAVASNGFLTATSGSAQLTISDGTGA